MMQDHIALNNTSWWRIRRYFNQSWVLTWILFSSLLGSSLAFAGGGGPAPVKTNFKWEASTLKSVGESFLTSIGAGEFEAAYASGDELLRSTRSLKLFQRDLMEAGIHRFDSVAWTNGVPSKDGYRLSGVLKLKAEGEDKARTVPFYINLIGDEHLPLAKRVSKGEQIAPWQVLDIQSTESISSRLSRGAMTGLDLFVFLMLFGMLAALIYMIIHYMKGLVGSPRELYLMFFTKLTEYSAYGAASYTFVLYLSRDIGLGDSGGAAYYTVFSLVMTITVMIVGAVCDTIGVKKTLLIGTFMLLTARFFMPLTTDIYFTTILGFLPFALGVAITGPVLKVGIKKFTTAESATLGFGLFYTLMNIGFAIGGWLFDYMRGIYGDGGSVTVPIFGFEISTYQAILGVGFFINIPDILAVLWMRDGIEMTEDGIKFHKREVVDQAVLKQELAQSLSTRRAAMTQELIKGAMGLAVIGAIIGVVISGGANPGKWGWAAMVFVGLLSSGLTIYALLSLISTQLGNGFERVMHAVRTATDKTIVQLKENFSEKPFWIYLFMLSVLVFVRLTFFIFHVMFPTYGIRVFGEGAQVGSIFGVLNPVLIVFFVPLISVLTTKVRSYTMLLIGTALSAGAVFLCFIPESIAISLGDGILGELIYDYWLGVPVGQRDPFYISLIIFIFFFSIGEAIWSPRLMQFSAEIAPKGKEGAYIALAILPYFVGKALAGGMSGFLIESYTPSTLSTFPDHKTVWLWIGGMAMISPIGLVIFRKLFNQVEQNALDARGSETSTQEDEAEQIEG